MTWHSSSVTVPLPVLHLPKPCNARPLRSLPGEEPKHIRTLPTLSAHRYHPLQQQRGSQSSFSLLCLSLCLVSNRKQAARTRHPSLTALGQPSSEYQSWVKISKYRDTPCQVSGFPPRALPMLLSHILGEPGWTQDRNSLMQDHSDSKLTVRNGEKGCLAITPQNPTKGRPHLPPKKTTSSLLLDYQTKPPH